LRIHYGLYATARDVDRFGRLWLGDGEFEGRRFFTPKLKAEMWSLHGTHKVELSRYGLLWWLFAEEGGYVMAGAGKKVVAVIPEAGVVLTILRLPLEPRLPIKFPKDKGTLVRLAVGIAG
jgi:CubicO group peptidase (beta-lactamase class C family)